MKRRSKSRTSTSGRTSVMDHAIRNYSKQEPHDHARASSVEPGLHLAGAPGAVPRGHAGAGEGLRRTGLLRAQGTAVDPSTIDAVAAAIAPFDQQVLDFLETQPDGRFQRGIDTVSDTDPRRPRSGCCATSVPHRVFPGSLPRPDRTRLRLYWEQSVYKAPHSAEPILWHPGQRVHVHGARPAYLTCWVALTDATLENAASGCSPACTANKVIAHTRTPRSGPSAASTRPDGRRPGEGGQHRRVLVAHAAHDRLQHDRRDPEGVHPPVRTRRCRRPAG